MEGNLITQYLRVLVGILESGENEFSQCIDALNKQDGVCISHFVISGKPKREAHDELYSTFMAQSSEADIFVKLDADMLLTRNSVLKEIATYLHNNKSILRLTVAVHDIISDNLVCGMHAWQNTMTWQLRDSELYTDRSPLSKGRSVIDYKLFAPAALHCSNPSPFQAFHYGMHRGLKLKDTTLLRPNRSMLLAHYKYYKGTIAAYRKNRITIRLLALIGFETAIGGLLNVDDISYTGTKALSIFRILCVDKNDDQLYNTWKKMRFHNTFYHCYISLCSIMMLPRTIAGKFVRVFLQSDK